MSDCAEQWQGVGFWEHFVACLCVARFTGFLINGAAFVPLEWSGFYRRATDVAVVAYALPILLSPGADQGKSFSLCLIYHSVCGADIG